MFWVLSMVIITGISRKLETFGYWYKEVISKLIWLISSIFVSKTFHQQFGDSIGRIKFNFFEARKIAVEAMSWGEYLRDTSNLKLSFK